MIKEEEFHNLVGNLRNVFESEERVEKVYATTLIEMHSLARNIIAKIKELGKD